MSGAALGAPALLGVYKPAAPLFVAGRGCWLIDDAGREYLDFTSGIGVNALGYGDAEIAAAVGDALATGLVHTSNLFRTAPAEALAAELVRLSFADRVFFCNSGGEANEAAFKFARRFAREVGGAPKHEVVAVRGSFHGRLFGSLAATDRPQYREPFEPLMPGVRFVAAEDEAEARAAVSAERTAAIIVEPVQGEGGVRVIGADYLRLLRELADEAGALLVFDEVQCGLGRTGRLFGHEHAGVTPDLMTLAKPLAGGLPMGAVLLTERVARAMQPGDHGTTFGGGPLVASVALRLLATVAAPGFLQGVEARGAALGAALARIAARPDVVETRGMGLMWGLELAGPAAPIVSRAMELGLLLTSAGERVVRLLPPLVVGADELEEGVALLEEALA